MKKLVPALVVLTGLAVGSSAAAQDPVKSNPDVYSVVLENANVRVLRVTVKPGGKTTMHDHPDTVVIAMSDAKVKFTGADGKAAEVPLKAEQAMWTPAEKHMGENLEKNAAEVILVELKPSKGPAATIPTNRPDMKITPFFDNARVMAYRATTGPKFHEPAGSTHDFDQVVIALQDTDAVAVNVDGKVKSGWKRGDVLFIGRGMKHESKNNGSKAADMIVVAVK
jgi:quercetin dioxygenase-like cupin family protein